MVQTQTKVSHISIHKINPKEFVEICWEAHAKIKPDLANYLQNIIQNHYGAIYAAYNLSGDCVGRIEVELHPGYKTRGKPCAIFGWLDGISPEVVELLLEQATRWLASLNDFAADSHKRFNLLRGPISMPKNFGGMGCQIDGFNMPRMHSVSTNRPELGKWIEFAGFKADTRYACVDVSNAPRWASAKLAPRYSIIHWTQTEWLNHETEALHAIQEAFTEILPDSSGPARFREVIDTMNYHPDSKYLNPIAIGPDGSIAGLIVSTPNLYEAWDGNQVTGVNVDTIFVLPQHRGMGLFSALNNVGRYNYLKYLQLTHVEGTSIWFANEKAVKTIFPHGTICRQHVVFQKRIKKEI